MPKKSIKNKLNIRRWCAIEKLLVPQKEDLYIGRFLDPKNDYVFQRIFGYIGNEEIKKYLSKWHIREDEYKSIVLTRNLEFCIIELPKYERYISGNKELAKWVKFIRNPEEIDMEDMNNNEALKKAKEELDKISDDEREEELAFQRLIYKMDQDACEALGYDKGMEVGIQQGIQEGIEAGEKNKAIEIAKNMLEKNMSIEAIVSCTGLTKEEIEELK